MSRLLAFVTPWVATVAVFLILFNNSDQGMKILVLLIGLNLAAVIVPWGRGKYSHIWTSARVASSCIAAALTALVGMELVFPVTWPQDYAQIRDLTKQFVGAGASENRGVSLVFSNPDQKTANRGAMVVKADMGARQWHNPGGRFAYYGYDPNLKASYVNLFRWNSEGNYDHDYHVARQRDTVRIMVVGDSYVESVQVPLSQSFHKLLEKSLNENRVLGRGKRAEVVALGNSGTGQVEHFGVLRTQVARYAPDMVMVCMSSNDVCDDDPELKRELVLSSGTITPLVRSLAAHGYYAMAFAVRRVHDLQRNSIAISPELLQWCKENIPRVEAAWDNTLKHVLQSRDFCKSMGIEFLLVYIGSDIEVRYALDPKGTVSKVESMGGPHTRMTWDMGRSVRRVSLFCRENGIPMVSLLEPLADAQKNTGHLVFGDHYTMFGHQVAALALGCALEAGLSVGETAESGLHGCSRTDFWREVPPVGAVAALGQPPDIELIPASGQAMPPGY